jgi:hypothetical protein
MAEEGIDQIIPNSKFLLEGSLTVFLEGLCEVSEKELLESNSPGALTDETVLPMLGQSATPSLSLGMRHALSLASDLKKCTHQLESPSESSAAWLEMILVEVALRNRDRFSSIWSLISSHYARTFAADLTRENSDPMILTHSIDR